MLDFKPEEKGIVFYDFAIDFIERRAKLKGIEDTSKTRDTYSLKKMCSFANLNIQDMNEELIERFFLENITISQSYINKIFQLMNRVFNEAIRKKIISENPMRWLEKPKSAKPTKIVRAMTVAEEQRLLKVLKTEDILYAPQMLLGLFTGCRMGEINALTVDEATLLVGSQNYQGEFLMAMYFTNDEGGNEGGDGEEKSDVVKALLKQLVK